MNEYVEAVAKETGLSREQVDECLRRLKTERSIKPWELIQLGGSGGSEDGKRVSEL